MPTARSRWTGFALLSPAAAVVGAAGAALVLAGWALDLAPFKSLIPGGVAMNPTSAATSLLAAVGLWLARDAAGPRSRQAGRACGLLVALIGLAVLAKYLGAWDHTLDTTLFGRLGDNRMAPNAAVFFVLVGAAVALLDRPGRRGHWPGQAAALLALGLCLLVLVGYSFGVRRLYGVGGHIPLAFNAGLVYTALAVAALFARPARGVPAALAGDGVAPALARRLVPAAIVVPWVVGWLRLAGERAGLYDTESGVALMTVMSITLFLGVIGLAVGSLGRSEAERRRAEATVRLFADVVRNIPTGLLVYQLDAAGDPPALRVRSANPVASDLLGVPLDAAAGKRIEEVFPAVTEATVRRFAAVAETGRPDDLGEFRYGDDRVAERWWAVQAFPLPDRSVGVAFEDVSAQKRAEAEVHRLNAELEGRVRQRTAELTTANAQLREEVAERRRAEESLREMRRQNELLLSAAGEGIYGLDRNGLTTFANPAAARLTGWPVEELIGKVQHALVHHTRPDGTPYPVSECPIYGALRDGAVRRVDDEVFWRKDGTSFPVEYVSSPIRDEVGQITGAVVVFKDVTERKRAEEAVRRSEARKAAVLSGALDCIITIDHAGRVVEFNPAAERTFGYPAAAAVGRDLADLIIPPRLRADHRRGLAHYLATGEGPVLNRRIELTAVRADGAEFPVEVAITPIAADPPLFTGFVRDITERKRAEEAVRQRTAELAEANRDLRQKNDENEMFVYSVSHDLRSPLVNLQGFSKELDKGCRALGELVDQVGVPADVRDPARALLAGKMAKSLGFIQTAVMRLSGIIDALLRLSRAGRVEYRWEAVDVGRVVAQVVGALQGTISEKKVAVRVGELPPAWGDRTAVEQVFANLIGNALNYLDPARPGRVEVGCQPDGPDGGRTYFVRDNGLGIPADHQPKIFRVFQRAHPGVAPGEGLGLAIVARVVERHKGRVWVESEPGVGSTFFVTLPPPPGPT